MIIQKDFPLSQILWYKIGGKAKYLLEAGSAEDIVRVFDFIENNNIQKVVIIGLGSNLIFPDNYFDGAVVRIVRNDNHAKDFQIKDDLVTVYSGTILDDLINLTFENNLTGLEWAGGLPGTIGAGIRGNVGAFGREIKESVFSVDVMREGDKTYAIETISKDHLEFSYRNSYIKKNKGLVIVSAKFNLKQVDDQDLLKAKNTYTDNINFRKTHHPIEYPTCGSVFKNIIKEEEINKIVAVWPDIKELIFNKWHGKVPMGFIIKRLGMSGLKIGNMQVSTKHSNFIINLGNGSYKDALSIINTINNKVQESFNFTPEIEVEIIPDK